MIKLGRSASAVRYKGLRLLFSILIFVAIPLLGQTSNGQDPKAIAVIQHALANAGEPNPLSAITDFTVSGTCAESENSATSITWISAPPYFRYVSGATGNQTVMENGTQGPFQAGDGGKVSLPAHIAYAMQPWYFPHWILATLLNGERYSLQMVPSNPTDAQNVILIKVTDTAHPKIGRVAEQIWTFDSSTGNPTKVDYRFPSIATPDRSAPRHVLFQDFHLETGVLVPSTVTTIDAQGASTQCNLQSWSFNTSPSQGFFNSGNVQ